MARSGRLQPHKKEGSAVADKTSSFDIWTDDLNVNRRRPPVAGEGHRLILILVVQFRGGFGDDFAMV
jgi:hypothetical protein